MTKRLLLTLLLLGICLPCYGADISKVSDKQVYKTTLGTDEVIIGDEKSLTFKPQITFTKWNKEVNLSIKSDKTFANSTTLNNKVYSVNGQKEDFYFKVNPDDANEFKFGLVLKEKPASNKFSYQLEGWEDLDFEYQYEEASDWILHPDKIISENDEYVVMNLDGVRTGIRKKVWKSWIVNHKTKRDHIEGQTNYGIGMIGEFLQPKFIDANGNWEMGDIDIKNGIYTVTIAQDFLDKAKYPILINDTFGDTNAYTTYDIPSKTCANKFTLSVAGTVTKITVYRQNQSAFGSENISVGMYDDDDGNYPSNLEITQVTISIPKSTAWGWQDFDVSDTACVAAPYWLASYSGNNAFVGFALYGTTRYVAANFPNPYTDGQSTTDRRQSIYATYTPTVSAALTGTVTSSITEADIVAGGKTIILTLTGDTWVTTGATFDGQRQNIINGIDSAQSEANGWDAEVKAKIAVTDVVRTSDTVCTITLDAEAGYNITATETITATIPASALTGAAQLVASPTFTVSAVATGYGQVI